MSASRSVNLKNVLLIGETGVGKSCVINLIFGSDVAEVPSSTEECTITKHQFENFCLFDTVGYNDTSQLDPTAALKKLKHLVKDTMDEGIALIVYIMKRGRVNAASKVNYDFFVKKFCDDKVPVLLVVTHCEEDSNSTNWYSGQKQNFENLNMNFADTVCGCAMKLPNPDTDPALISFYQKKRDKTREEIRRKMEQLVLDNPWKPPNWIAWIPAIFLGALVFSITTATIAAFLPQIAIAFRDVVFASTKDILKKK